MEPAYSQAGVNVIPCWALTKPVFSMCSPSDWYYSHFLASFGTGRVSKSDHGVHPHSHILLVSLCSGSGGHHPPRVHAGGVRAGDIQWVQWLHVATWGELVHQAGKTVFKYILIFCNLQQYCRPNGCTASIFYGIWIKQSGAMVCIANLDKVSPKKLFSTMNI